MARTKKPKVQIKRQKTPLGRRRSVFLERCGAMLKMRRRFTDDDVRQVAELALCGLVQTADSGVKPVVILT